MELPKNITQIGEVNHNCKIYVEDYVVSYMKQLNRIAEDKDMAVALYGTRKEEEGVLYLFVYGAGKINFLQKETRQLSGIQKEEIESVRKKYFEEYIFLGYRLLNGEMLEGIHVQIQNLCTYVSGFAQFYEKNEKMLAYMLEIKNEGPSEVVNQEKYEMVKKRQEERRERSGRQSFLDEERGKNRMSEEMRREIMKKEKGRMEPGKKEKVPMTIHGIRVASFFVFSFLCLVGLSALNGSAGRKETNGNRKTNLETFEALEAVADQVVEEVETPSSMEKERETLTISLEKTLEEEELVINTQSNPLALNVEGEVDVKECVEEKESVGKKEQVEQEVSVTQVMAVENVVPNPQNYIIQSGDTLIAICKKVYGGEERVQEICKLNGITNPDDIQEGSTILLPQ